MKQNLKFIGKVAMIHIATYILCGLIFSTIFNYGQLYLQDNVKGFMRPIGGVSTIIGPMAQIIRGVLFGIILLFMKDYFAHKYGWLKLWAIIVVIGIINTPAPAPFSIEGVIYTQLPLEFQLKGAPEILLQTFLFSYLAAKPQKVKKQNQFVEKNKTALLISAIGGIGFSMSGIVLSFILKINVMEGTRDIGAFIIMFLAMVIAFLITNWYCTRPTKLRAVVVAAVYYAAIAILPTAYNFAVDSPFKSFLALAVNAVPVGIMLLFLYFSDLNIRREEKLEI